MSIFRMLLALFFLVPLIEIYLLINVGGLIGALPTVFMVVFTAVLGALLIRFQGISTMQRVHVTLSRGEIPALEMLEGVVLLISGALLLTPGFFTDVVGFLGLIPSVRRRCIVWFLRHQRVITGASSPHSSYGSNGPRTIEGEAWRSRDDDQP